MSGQQVGYVRVSTVDQNTGRQLEGVQLNKTFTDKVSGKSTDRPQLHACVEYVREGDTLHVHSMDRLARNLDDLRRLVRQLNDKGVAVHFHKENLIFTGEDSPMANLLLSLLGAVAQFELSLIRERQLSGIALAKAAGRYKGSKPKLNAEQVAILRSRVAEGVPKARVAREMNISRETLYTYLAAPEPEPAAAQ